MKGKAALILLLVGFLAAGAVFYPRYQDNLERLQRSDTVRSVFHEINELTDRSESSPDLPIEKIMPAGTHVFQTFNNCGPASLSIALSLYGINIGQAELGNEMRPYQNQAGNNDDKSVTLAEIATKAEDFGFTSIRRPNGSVQMLKEF